MYPKTPGCFSDLSAALYYKSYCFFLKLLIVLPVHFPLLHFTPPKVLRFYYNLTFRCVRYFGGSAILRFNEHKFLFANPKHLDSSGKDANHLQQNYIMGFVFPQTNGSFKLDLTDEWNENLNEVCETLDPDDAVNEND